MKFMIADKVFVNESDVFVTSHQFSYVLILKLFQETYDKLHSRLLLGLIYTKSSISAIYEIEKMYSFDLLHMRFVIEAMLSGLKR